jgi:allantoicase
MGSHNWQKHQQHAPCGILKMSVNGASTIFSFASGVCYIPIGVSHPFTRYWQPLLAKTTVTGSLRHPENERQQRVNSYRTCIFRDEGIARNFACITVILTALLDKNTIYRR